MDKFYQFFADTFPQLFGFVGKAIPALADAAQLVKTIVLIACLALAAFAVVILVIGCFKVRFFRRLARVLLVIETLGMVGLILIALNTVKTGDFVADLVKALEVGSPAVFDLIKGIFSDFGAKTVPSFIIILVTFVVISLLLHLIIVLSRIIIKRANAKAEPDQPEELPAAETTETSPAPAPAAAPAEAVVSTPVEEPIVPADVPEPEMETVIEADAAPAVTDEPAAEEEAEEPAAEEVEEVAEAEDSAEPETAPVPDYPKLDCPVFMPVPSSVSETVDFTDPKRDGFAPNPGVPSGAAEKLIPDETAEDLTVVVYRKVNGRVADLPIDALNENFKPYSYIDVRILRQKGLIPENAAAVRITGFGKVEKPLMIEAWDFAPGVAKMIILAGGRPIQIL